eukprot:1035531-Rhodomonas_salina.2
MQRKHTPAATDVPRGNSSVSCNGSDAQSLPCPSSFEKANNLVLREQREERFRLFHAVPHRPFYLQVSIKVSNSLLDILPPGQHQGVELPSGCLP